MSVASRLVPVDLSSPTSLVGEFIQAEYEAGRDGGACYETLRKRVRGESLSRFQWIEANFEACTVDFTDKRIYLESCGFIGMSALTVTGARYIVWLQGRDARLAAAEAAVAKASAAAKEAAAQAAEKEAAQRKARDMRAALTEANTSVPGVWF